MSGSSPGGGIPSINRPNENEDCQSLAINTNLASPQADVIDMLRVGYVLDISAVSDHGPIQAIFEGHLAGNIITREQVRLINCIIAGTIFEAEVTAISNGQCTVQIRAI